MVLSRLTKITGPGIRTDTNWVGNNANYTGILTASSLGGIGNLTATGIITASSFSGDGSGLIGVASTDNIVTGTAATFNTYPVDINAGMTVAGVATFAGNVSIAGTLTYEDVTNVDSVGLVTARTGVISPYADIDDFISVGSNIHLGNAGVVTATSFVGSGAALTGIDATSIKDSGGNVKIQAQASGAVYTGIHTFNSDLDVDGHTNLDNVSISGVVTATTFSGSGASLTGIANANVASNAAIAGSKIAAQFDGQDITGRNINLTHGTPTLGLISNSANPDFMIQNQSGKLIFQDTTNSVNRLVINTDGHIDVAGNLDVGAGIDVTGNSTFVNDIDVDGHTNLDNVSVAGVTTFAENINISDKIIINCKGFNSGNEQARIVVKAGDNSAGGGLRIVEYYNDNTTLFSSEIANFYTTGIELKENVSVTGNITVSGTVDGVDIAALNTTVGTKLANVVEDASPQLGGELQSNGNHIRLSDEKYVWFGTTGTGIAGYSSGIYFEGNSTGKTIYIRPKLNQQSIKAEVSGPVTLYHSGNQKLTTESDGVKVTGLMETDRTRNVPITTTQRNALGTPDEGTMIYNDTLKKLQVYTDGNWISFSGKVINVGGGTISNDANRSGYVVHTFTSPGTFTTSAALEGVEIMVVGGGGGGGGHRYGSGGGAGGVIMRPASPAYPLSSPQPVVVGAGGAGAPGNGTGSGGQNSTFGSGPMTLIGEGGGGGTSYDGPVYSGRPGGSGGGGTSRASSTPGGSATQPGTHGAGTDYGNRGGNYNVPGGGWAPCGGGGAGGSGTDTPTTHSGGGNGAIGVQLSISGSATYYAGGGAGGIYNNQSSPNSYYGVGGNGGGGSSWNSVPGSYQGHSQPGAGAANSGGGGCGAHGQNAQPLNNSTNAGLAGGSGIVIVAYPTTQPEGDVIT